MVDLSSALLLPSKIETFGSVAFEAMARGQSVIVSKNAGINEWDTLSENILQLEHEGALIKTIQTLIDMDYERVISQILILKREFANTVQQWIDLLLE